MEWFAQDRTGTVWYFGEDTTSYESGSPDTHGSFRRPALTVPSRVSPVEPKVAELWFYAKGVGAVLALDISDGDHREELVRVKRGR